MPSSVCDFRENLRNEDRTLCEKADTTLRHFMRFFPHCSVQRGLTKTYSATEFRKITAIRPVFRRFRRNAKSVY